MAQMEDRPKKKKHFLGCFGFSIFEKKRSAGSKKKSKSLFSFSKSVKKHSSAAKTIPVNISEKFDNRSSREIHVVKTEKKGSVKTLTTAGDVTQLTVKSQRQTNIVHDKTKDHKTQDIIHRNNKSLDQLLDNVRESRNEFSRSVTISSMSHFDSPKDKHEIKLPHSVSLPSLKRKKSMTTGAIATGKVNDERSSHRHDQEINNSNFDSIIGMSILMVTLLIMLFWGKACAIICTCAWFYFLPRLRPENEPTVARKNDGVAGDVDMNSDEYKKKVVLEGFLERNHRNV